MMLLKFDVKLSDLHFLLLTVKTLKLLTTLILWCFKTIKLHHSWTTIVTTGNNIFFWELTSNITTVHCSNFFVLFQNDTLKKNKHNGSCGLWMFLCLLQNWTLLLTPSCAAARTSLWLQLYVCGWYQATLESVRTRLAWKSEWVKQNIEMTANNTLMGTKRAFECHLEINGVWLWMWQTPRPAHMCIW